MLETQWTFVFKRARTASLFKKMSNFIESDIPLADGQLFIARQRKQIIGTKFV